MAGPGGSLCAGSEAWGSWCEGFLVLHRVGGNIKLLCAYAHMWAPHGGGACRGVVPVPKEPNDATTEVMALGLLSEVVGSEHPSSLLCFRALNADITGDGSLPVPAAPGSPDPG